MRTAAVLALVLLLGFASRGAADDTDPGGGTPGLPNGNPNLPKSDAIGDVDAGSGAFQSEIQIDVPEYRGTAPRVSLLYSSSSGNGFVGRGWQLSAESYIDRVSPGRGAPRYDSSDAYALDGLELVTCSSLSGQQRTRCQAMGGTHAGRRQTYQRITRSGSGTNVTWTVLETSGLKKTYTPLILESGQVYRWGLSFIDDPHGTANRVTYAYTGSTSSLERYLSSISYGPYRVCFAQLPRSDSYFVSTGKRIAEYDQQLGDIEIRLNSCLSSRIRRYDVEYTTSAMSTVSVIRDVRRVGSDDSTALPAVDPNYYDDSHRGGEFGVTRPNYSVQAALPIQSSTNSGTNWLTGDFNGDGRTDLFQFPRPTNFNNLYGVWLALGLSGGVASFDDDYYSAYGVFNTGTWVVGDFDGDGRSDLLHAGLNVGESRVWISNGTSFSTSMTLLRGQANDGNNYPAFNAGRWQAADFNGDGLSDLFHAGNVNGRADVWLATGNGAFDHSQTLSFSTSFNADKAITFPIDLNGDGRTDIVQVPLSLNQLVVYIANVDGSLTGAASVPRPASAPLAGGGSRSYGGNLWAGPWAAGDFNGDGLTDLAHGAEDDYLFTWFSEGDGTFSVVADFAASYGPRLDEGGQLLAGDQDGDGKTDLIHIGELDAELWVWYSAGDGGWVRDRRLRSEHSNYTSAISLSDGHWHSGDFDGDGVSDLFHAPQNSSESNRRVRIWTGDRPDFGDLLSDITFELGARLDITYRSSTGISRQYLPVGTVLPVVDEFSRSDGRSGGTADTFSFVYQNADWSKPERCFLDFGTVAMTDDIDNRVTTTQYLQNDSCIVQPDTVERKISGSSHRLFFTDDDYTGSHTLLPYDSLLLRERERVYTGFDSNFREVTTEFEYTTHGVVRTTREFGDGTAGDERLTIRTFAGPSVSYVVDQPYQIDVYEGIAAPVLASSFQRYYDNQALGASVVTGDLTFEDRWNSDTGLYDHRTVRVYDGFGNVLRTTKENGVTDSVAYDVHNLFPEEECAVWTSPTQRSYCTFKAWNVAFQKIATATDLNAETTTTAYDVLGRVDHVLSPDPSSPTGAVLTDFEYLSIGNPDAQRLAITAPDHLDGLREELYFDGLGRVWSERWEGNRDRRDTAYLDTGERVAAQTLWYDPGTAEPPRWTDLDYDAHRRMDRVTHPTFGGQGRAFEQIVHAVVGGRTSESRYRARYPSEPQPAPVTTWRDGLRRAFQVDSAAGSAVYDLDALDNVRTATQFGDQWSFTWNSLGELRASTDPDRGPRSFTYHPGSLLFTETDAKGQVTTFQYDALDRVTQRVAQGGATTTWDYDAIVSPDPDAVHFPFDKSQGRLVRVTYPEGRELHHWNRAGLEAGNMRCVGSDCRFFFQTYDVAARLDTLTYPDGEPVVHTYDSLGRLQSLPGIVSNISWTARARGRERQFSSVSYANGVVATFHRSPERGWLNDSSVLNGGTPVYQASYQYYGDANIQQLTSSTHPRLNFLAQYDALQRLEHVIPLAGNPEAQQDFSYFPNGNIWTNSRISGAFEYQDPAHVHAVTRAGDVRYEYDANGSLLSAAKCTPGCVAIERLLQYDRLDQVEWVSSGGATYRYAYDGEGARIRRIGPDRTTRYFGRLFEVDDAGFPLVQTKFYYAGDLLVAKSRDGVRSYYHLDHLGSPHALTDAGAPVAEAAKYEYGPFGDARSQVEAAGLENRRGFTGHQDDEQTGLVYMGARYYDPVVGRFLSPDPADPRSLEAQAWNRYSYVSNNPLNAFDPTGLEAVSVLAGFGFSGLEAGGSFALGEGTLSAIGVGAGQGLLIGAAGGIGFLIGTQIEPFLTPGIQSIFDRVTGFSDPIVFESRNDSADGEDQEGFDRSTDAQGNPRKKSPEQKRLDRKRKQDARSPDRTVEDASQKVEDVRDFAPDQSGKRAKQAMKDKTREFKGRSRRGRNDE